MGGEGIRVAITKTILWLRATFKGVLSSAPDRDVARSALPVLIFADSLCDENLLTELPERGGALPKSFLGILQPHIGKEISSFDLGQPAGQLFEILLDFLKLGERELALACFLLDFRKHCVAALGKLVIITASVCTRLRDQPPGLTLVHRIGEKNSRSAALLADLDAGAGEELGVFI